MSQSLNAFSPIYITPLPISTFTNSEQVRKAPLPIYLTESGIITSVILVEQYKKALFAIHFVPSLIVTTPEVSSFAVIKQLSR